METNRGIFLTNETTGSITTTLVQATGDTTIYSREILEDSLTTTERTFLLSCPDDDSSTPTIQVLISLRIGDSWTAYTEIEEASVVPKEVKISSYGKSWWFKNNGVKFQIVKSGAGAVTHAKGQWV